MSLLGQLSERAPNRVFASIVIGGISGACYSLLIPLVQKVIGAGDPRLEEVKARLPHFLTLQIAHAPFALVFALLCAVVLFGRSLSQILLTRLAIDVTSELRIELYERIVRAPLPSLERIGSSRVIAALTTDIPRIVNGARVIPDVLINAVALLGMLAFLLILNVHAFDFVIGCIFFGIVTYQLPMERGRRHFAKSRLAFDGLQEAIQGLTRGVKELKLDEAKRRAFFDDVLLAHEQDVRRQDKAGHTLVRIGTTYGDLISFVVIGCMLFIFVNYRMISNAELVGVVMALLYITGPVALILNYLPQLSLSRVSLQRFEQLAGEIDVENATRQIRPTAPWQTLRLHQLSYRHASTGDRAFSVGPVDLEIAKGRITFIVGGNGSGKSTLSKLLTLHYRAASGRMTFGDQDVDDDSVASLRQCICAIYSDYYLFDRMLGRERHPGLVEQVQHYLALMRLDHKVKFEGGRFSTLALSDGQRRRMALLMAIIEDKDLYLFDEWAADQDPEFKEIFYRDVLPSLCARNKAVVVISHDDRYFHVADQLVTMSEGKVVEVRHQDSSAHRSQVPGSDWHLAPAGVCAEQGSES